MLTPTAVLYCNFQCPVASVCDVTLKVQLEKTTLHYGLTLVIVARMLHERQSMNPTMAVENCSFCVDRT